MTTYQCQTCGETHTMSADAWAWHRLVDHPRMGLPVHDPGRLGNVRETPAERSARHHEQQRAWYANRGQHTEQGIATND